MARHGHCFRLGNHRVIHSCCALAETRDRLYVGALSIYHHMHVTGDQKGGARAQLHFST